MCLFASSFEPCLQLFDLPNSFALPDSQTITSAGDAAACGDSDIRWEAVSVARRFQAQWFPENS